jgi:hypothetical protein
VIHQVVRDTAIQIGKLSSALLRHQKLLALQTMFGLQLLDGCLQLLFSRCIGLAACGEPQYQHRKALSTFNTFRHRFRAFRWSASPEIVVEAPSLMLG